MAKLEFEQLALQTPDENDVLTAIDIAHDSVFNYTRTVTPMDDEGNAETLSEHIGENSPIEGIAQDIIVRDITSEERERWTELHRSHAPYKALTDEEFDDRIPNFIVVDGFGRVEALKASDEEGENTPIPYKYVDMRAFPQDEWKARSLIIGGMLNSTQRKTHYFDELALYETLRDTGLSMADIARRMGRSRAYVTGTFQLSKLTVKQRQKCRENRTVRYRAVELANRETKAARDGNNQTGTDYAPEGKPLSVAHRKMYMDGIAFAREDNRLDLNTKDGSVLDVVTAVLKFTNGGFGSESFSSVLHDHCGISHEIGYDFENDTQVIQEDIRQKKATKAKAEKAAVAKKKEDDKKAAAKKKEADKKASDKKKAADKKASDKQKAADKAAKAAKAKKSKDAITKAAASKKSSKAA